MISSRHNRTIKWIRSLHTSKARRESGLFMVDGARLVATALQTNATIQLMAVSPELIRSSLVMEVIAHLTKLKVPCIEVSAEVFRSIRPDTSSPPQGIAALIRRRVESLANVQTLSRDDLWVGLDSVQYPGNLGTILRTSDSVGARGVVLIGHTADPFDPTSIRASTGAIFSQRLVRASFEEFRSWVERTNVRIIGTSPSATTSFRSSVYERPLVVLMGSEGAGLSKEHARICSEMVCIPMRGYSDSLNLAIATSIILYEIYSQGQDQG